MKNFFQLKALLSMLLFLVFVQFSNAQDRVFCRTYQTNILPYGAMELEYLNTIRSGRVHYYNAIDQRLELEVGLGKNVQTAFYINLHSLAYSPNDHYMIRESRIGFSNEWKVKISDPVANGIGSALYGEIGFDGQELELEGKLILDKRINNHLFAMNLVGEYEVGYEAANGKIEAETENPFELDLAYMNFIGSSAGLGLEIRNHNEMKEGEWENSAWFAGPAFHYHGKRFFINLNVMPQLFNMKKEEGVSDTRDLVDHEKVEFQMLLSFSF